ncbi:MAG: FxsA family protein [Sneathiella sp.]|nr:FxsA family protein [Sneathiella sp.]
MEISVFIQVGGEIGAFNTIILTIFTAVAGVALLRTQGLSVLMKAQETLKRGETPLNEIFSGILLALAGLFLLIPGFVTDGLGFLLFLPPLRNAIAHWLSKNVKTNKMGGFQNMNAGQGQGFRPKNSTVIDGEFHEVDPNQDSLEKEDVLIEQSDKANKDSPWSKNK